MSYLKSRLIGAAVSLALSTIVSIALLALLFWLHPEAASHDGSQSFSMMVGAIFGLLSWWRVGIPIADWLENRETRV